ncbi:MAG: hypothetical protein HEEMFOPI_01948 [Holosporales bacterium]
MIRQTSFIIFLTLYHYQVSAAERCTESDSQTKCFLGQTQSDELEFFLKNNGFDKNKEGDTPAHIAASLNNTGIMRLLIEKRAELCAKNKDKNRPLHIAMQAGHKEMVELLINNVDPKMLQKENRMGKTPLMLAAENGHNEIIISMFEHKIGDSTYTNSFIKCLEIFFNKKNVTPQVPY